MVATFLYNFILGGCSCKAGARYLRSLVWRYFDNKSEMNKIFVIAWSFLGNGKAFISCIARVERDRLCIGLIWGWGKILFYKVEVEGWYVMGWASLVSVIG